MVIRVRADWSPLGAAHFLQLVEAGYLNQNVTPLDPTAAVWEGGGEGTTYGAAGDSPFPLGDLPSFPLGDLPCASHGE
jgi:hypothetical protein